MRIFLLENTILWLQQLIIEVRETLYTIFDGRYLTNLRGGI